MKLQRILAPSISQSNSIWRLLDHEEGNMILQKSVNIYQLIQCNNPEHMDLQKHCRGNIKSSWNPCMWEKYKIIWTFKQEPQAILSAKCDRSSPFTWYFLCGEKIPDLSSLRPCSFVAIWPWQHNSYGKRSVLDPFVSVLSHYWRYSLLQ